MSKKGIITAREIIDVKVSTSITYLFTGGESFTDITLDEILTPAASYNSAKAITQLNNQLVLANMGSEEVIDFQAIANRMVINYSVQEVQCTNVTAQNASKKSTATRSFQSGEVYAFYFVLELNNGQQLAYHIPGRGPTGTDRSDVSSPISGKRYQIYDTANTPGGLSNMGFWENQSERYPDDFPAGRSFGGATEALAGQKVRHHKFPDLSEAITLFAGGPAVGRNSLLQFSVNVSNIVIPTEIRAKIKAWRLAYAKRGYENSTVLGVDTMHLTADSGDATGLLWSTGGNWNIKARNGSGDGGWQDMHLWLQPSGGDSNSPIFKAIRGHCLDLLYDKPAVIPDHINIAYKLKSTGLSTAYSGFRGPGGTLQKSGESRGQQPGVVVDWTKGGAQKTLLTAYDVICPVSNYQYIPQHVQIGLITSKRNEGFIYSECSNLVSLINSHGSNGIKDTGIDNGFPWMFTQSSGATVQELFGTPGARDWESTYIYHYKRVVSDVYVSYTNQQLIATQGRSANLTSSGPFTCSGGDINLCLLTYMTTTVQSPTIQDGPNAAVEGLRAFKYYVGEARHNWNFRHEETAGMSDKYAPKTDPRDFWTPRANPNGSSATLINTDVVLLNKLNYNPDYDLLNEFLPAVIVGDLDDFTSEAPTTIIYSDVQGFESQNVSWRTFAAGNRHVQPRNKGEIINIQGFQNKELIIHHENSLFVTQGNTTLATNTNDINLSSSDLFAIPPKEKLTTESGFAGTQHSLSCKVTKIGYCFVDDSQGKIFSFDGEALRELSYGGNRNFFRDNFTGVEDDNPWNGSGYTMAFDEQMNRLIVGKAPKPVVLLENLSVTSSADTLAEFSAPYFQEGSMLEIDPPKPITMVLTVPGPCNVVIQYVDGESNPIELYSGPATDIITVTATDTSSEGYFTYMQDVAGLATADFYLGNPGTQITASLSCTAQTPIWASFHDYVPDYMFSLPGNTVLSFKDSTLYVHNKGPRGRFYNDEVFDSYVDVVFNPQPDIDKKLKVIEWMSPVYNSSGKLLPNNSLTSLTVRSEDKCTGKIDLFKITDTNLYNVHNIKNIGQNWTFNNFFDITTDTDFLFGFADNYTVDPTKLNINMPWYQRRNFNDKYVICRFEFSNLTNYKLLLLDVNASFAPSHY